MAQAWIDTQDWHHEAVLRLLRSTCEPLPGTPRQSGAADKAMPDLSLRGEKKLPRQEGVLWGSTAGTRNDVRRV